MPVNVGPAHPTPPGLADLLRLLDAVAPSVSFDGQTAAGLPPPRPDGAPRIPAHLARLQQLRGTLDTRQSEALTHLDVTARLLVQEPRNMDFFSDSVVQWMEKAGAAGLKRRASFLLAVPAAHDLASSLTRLGATGGVVPAQPVPDAERMLMTAQAATFKLNCEAVTDAAVGAARAGERYCPLTLQPERFKRFLSAQRPAIGQVRHACTLDGAQRRPALRDALAQLAHAYLKTSGNLPQGLQPGCSVRVGDDWFPEAPVSLVLSDKPGSASTFCREWYGDTAVIMIGVDDLDRPDADPRHGSPTSLLHSEGMEGLSVAQQQAGVYLQKLFVELVHLEEEIHLTRHRNKDGSIMDTARATEHELTYDGTPVLGDSLVARRPPWKDAELPTDSMHQRGQTLDAFDRLSWLARHYPDVHGQPLLTDPDIDAWICSPIYYRDKLKLQRPASRLQLGSMERFAGVLRETRVLD